MARKTSNSDDSLELLLDTMCNAFGGIVIIAILVALLMRQTGRTPDDNEHGEAVAAIKLPGTEKDLQVEKALLEKLTNEVAAHGELAKLVARLNQLVVQRSQLLALIDSADLKDQNKKAQARAATENVEAAIAQAAAAKLTMTGQLAVLAKEIEELRAQIEKARKDFLKWGGENNSRPVKRPPVEQKATKKPFFFILRHGKVFPLQEYTGSQNSGGSIKPSNKHIDWQGDVALLKNGAGLDAEADKPELIKMLDGLPEPDKRYVVSIVYRDSFETYLKFQKVLSETNSKMDSGWVPMAGDGDIQIGSQGILPPMQ